MESRFLEVTFRKGKPVAAYLYLTADNGVKSHRSQKAERGLVLDYGETDQLIGIEITSITSPARATLASVNEVLSSHQLQPLADAELSPLQAA